jgi:hypothetical protein
MKITAPATAILNLKRRSVSTAAEYSIEKRSNIVTCEARGKELERDLFLAGNMPGLSQRRRRRARRCIPAAETGDKGRPNGSMNSAHGPVVVGTVPSRSLML